MGEKSVLERLIALKDEGKFRLLSHRLLFLSAMSSAASFGTITQKEVLQKMMDNQYLILYKNLNFIQSPAESSVF